MTYNICPFNYLAVAVKATPALVGCLLLVSGRIAVAAGTRQRRIVDLTRICKPLETFDTGLNECDMAFSPDSLQLAVGAGVRGIARLFDLSTMRALQSFRVHSDMVDCVLTYGTNMLATGDDSGSITLWNTRSGKVIRVLSSKDGESVVGICTNSNADELFACLDGAISKWNRSTGTILKSIRANDSTLLYGIAYNSVDNLLATCSSSPSVDVRNAATLAKSWTVGQHNSHPVNHVAFTPDGRYLVAGDQGGITWVWRVTSRKLKYKFGELEFGTSGLAVSPDSKYIVVSGGYSFNIWSVKPGNNVAHIRPPERIGNQFPEKSGSKMCAIVISPNGKWIATSGADGLVQVWDFQKILHLSKKYHE
jgi:WD40 repeat protein